MNFDACSDVDAGIEQKKSVIQTRVLFGSNCSLNDIRDNYSGSETYRKWPSEIGFGHVTMIQLRPGLLLGIGSCRLKEHVEFKFEYSETNAPIFFGYAHSGSVTYTLQSKSNLQCIISRPGHKLTTYLPGEQCVFRSPIGVNVSTIGIAVDPRLLKTWVGEEYIQAPADLRRILDNAQQPFSQLSNSSPETHTILNQILTCAYRGELKRLYLEAKVLELIIPHIAPPNDSAFRGSVPLNKHDADLIREAEFLLRENLEAPPSLPELAFRVGVNKNKLNQGFRKIFGTSVFDHLRILRLERARELLQNEHKSVTEVAYEVGYTHPENFTRAFKKHFCTSPKDHLL